MPRVIPTLDQQTPLRPVSDARLGVRATPAAFGAAVGQGLSQIGDVANHELVKQKNDADSLAVMAADKQLADWEAKHVYDAQTGALNVKGKEALKQPDAINAELEKTIGQLDTTLTNADQKRAFQQIAQHRQEQIRLTLERHAAHEYEAYDASETAAYVKNSQSLAADNYTDPARVKSELQRQSAAIEAHGIRAGLAPDVIKLQKSAALSTTHVAVIDRMLSTGDYKAAEDYYKVNGGAIDGTVRAGVEKAIHEGAVRGTAQQYTDKIMTAFSSESDALAGARKIDDPEIRDAVVQRIKNRFAEQEALKQQNVKDIIDSATHTISQGGTVDDIPPQQWAQLSKDQRANLKALQHRGEWYQDDQKWYKFTQMTPKQIAGMNLYADVRPYVDDAHWNMALEMQKKAKAAENGDNTALTASLNFHQRLNNALVSSGLFDKTTGLEGDDAARYANLQTEAAHELQLKEEALGRKATGDEVQQVLDNMMLHRVFLNEWGVDPQRQIINVPKDEIDSAYVPKSKIPAAAQAQIENLGRSLGVSVSDDKLQRAYAAALMGDDARVQAILLGR